MPLKRPRRDDFESEPDYLIACLRYLDARFPGREGQRKRIAAFERWESSSSTPERMRARLGQLFMDEWPLSDEKRAELDRLVAAWNALPSEVQNRVHQERKRTT